MNSNTLFDITREYLEVFDRIEIDEETGEILNAEELDTLQGAFDEKAESVACYIKNLDAFTKDIKEEEAKMAERRKSAEKKVEYFKRYLTSCLDAVGRDKLETPKVKIGFRKSTQVQIDDESSLPSDFVVETVTTKPDKTAIKKAIQAGQEVTGASLIENRNIQIK